MARVPALDGEAVGVDIGNPVKVRIVEPLVLPIPEVLPDPHEAPAAPEPAREREPDEVPA